MNIWEPRSTGTVVHGYAFSSLHRDLGLGLGTEGEGGLLPRPGEDPCRTVSLGKPAPAQPDCLVRGLTLSIDYGLAFLLSL